MNKCADCNKEFKYQYMLQNHKKRKTPCNKTAGNTKCEVCNIQFRWEAEKKRHDNTQRHIAKNSIINNVSTMNNSTINNVINNIHISLNPMNIFSKTNINLLKEYDVMSASNTGVKDWTDFLLNNDRTEDSYDYFNDKKRNTIYMSSLLDILKELNFNMSIPQNNNCKILIFVSNDEKTKNDPLYLILEMNETNQYSWKQITYEIFITELIVLMNEIKKYFNIENFNTIIDHINTYVKDNESMKQKMKKELEQKTTILISKFICNSDPNVDNRKEMKNFIDKETKLYNGVESTIDLICRDLGV